MQILIFLEGKKQTNHHNTASCLSDLILANKATQEHLAEVEESKAVMEKELREKISKLEKELENANDLLSATKRKGMDNTGN